MTGQTPKCKPQKRWIGVPGITGGDTFSFGGQMGTGVLRLLGGEVENRYVRRGPTSYSVIGEAMFRPQSSLQANTPSRLPAKTCYKFSIYTQTGCILLRMRVLLTLTSRQKYFKPFSRLKLATGARAVGLASSLPLSEEARTIRR